MSKEQQDIVMTVPQQEERDIVLKITQAKY
jgi:hypothetical protein